MPYLVTDNTCGHTILTAADRNVADHQAHVADVAGYPTTTVRAARLGGHALCPPRDCDHCYARVAATIVVMARDRVADRAITAGACPFEAVALFDRLRARGMTLEDASSAVTRPDAMRSLAARAPVGRWPRPRRELDPPNIRDQDLDPAWFTEPATYIEPPCRTP